MKLRDRFRGCLLGLAIGDALGTTVEFKSRGSFEPLTGIVGGGPFHLSPGQWTDDTSMALCLATSLLERGGFDPTDQMMRYLKWYEEGHLSSTGVCFDIGNTVRTSLERFKATGDPFSGSTDPQAAGNGSLMRLAPVPMFYFPDRAHILKYAAASSRTTHAAQECLDACQLFADILLRALHGADKDRVLVATDPGPLPSPSIRDIATGSYRDKPVNAVVGSGYVVQSLEAALWSFLHTEDFRSAVLTAANLGDDADTTAAICGQVAGAFYGERLIPREWLDVLAMRAKIGEIAEALLAASDAT